MEIPSQESQFLAQIDSWTKLCHGGLSAPNLFQRRRSEKPSGERILTFACAGGT